MKRFGWLIAIALALLTPAWALARAGGGEGYSGGGDFGGGGGGYGGGGGGSGDGELIFWLIHLCIRYPKIGIPVVLVLIAFFILSARRGHATHQTRTIRRGNTLVEAAAQARAVEQLRVADPSFDDAAFLNRVRTAFFKVQEGWCAQDLTQARPFISDAIAERFALQFEEQRAFGERNQLKKLRIDHISIATVQPGEVFDVLSVRIVASAIDTYVSLDTSRHLRGLKRPVPFVEIWSFLRRRGARTQADKPGLIEGNCPNCGAAIELNQWSRCQYCTSLLRSGEYDWVLAEITQEVEWQPEHPAALPGVEQMRQHDPEFNLQALEDRASVVFWRWAAAQRLGDVAPLRKVASGGWCDAMQGSLQEATNVPGRRMYIGRCAVGAVRTLGVVHEARIRRALVEVRWSGKHLIVERDGRPREGGSQIVAKSMLVFERDAAATTDAAQSLSAAHCPNCGAPESQSSSNRCEHCGTTLNRTDLGWVLTGFHDMLSPEARAHRQRLKQADLGPIPLAPAAATAAVPGWLPGKPALLNGHPPADLLMWMTRMVFADRERHPLEEQLLYHTAERHAVPRETVERMIEAAQDGILEAPMPATQEAGIQWLEAMAGIAVADGRVDPGEARLLQSLAKRLGYSAADINLMLKRQHRARYTEARQRVRQHRRGQPIDLN